MMIVTRSHWLGLKASGSRPRAKSPQHHPHVPWSSAHVVLYVCCTRAALMYSTRADTQMVELVVALDTRSGEILCFVYTMVIKTELWTRVHSPVVRAADCRSAGPWFNSGWRHWIHIHWHVQRNNIMSPITTTITMPMTTIPRKSVNIFSHFLSFCFIFFHFLSFFFVFLHFLFFSFIFYQFLSFSFIFLHFPSFSFIFLHFLSFPDNFCFFSYFPFFPFFHFSFIFFYLSFIFFHFSFIFFHFLSFSFIFFFFVGCSKSDFFRASISLRFLLTVLM